MGLNPGLLEEETKWILPGLEATVFGRYQGSDPQERRIDAFCDLKDSGGYGDFGSPTSSGQEGPIGSVLGQGFDIVPALMEHRDDLRLTRTFQGRFMNAPTRLVTVGDLCRWILGQIKGPEDKSTLEVWWRTASSKTEKVYLSDALDVFGRFRTATIQDIAEKRHPDLLVEAFDRALTQGVEDQADKLLKSMERSTLPREAVTDAALKATARPIPPFMIAGLRSLQRIGSAVFEAELLRALKQVPMAEAMTKQASFAKLALTDGSPEVLAELLAATRRANPTLRSELLEYCGCGRKAPVVRRREIAYQLAFLDDPTVEPSLESWDKKPRIASKRIGNLAAIGIAESLGIRSKPDEKASGAVWTAFRDLIRKRAERFLATQLG